MSESVLNAHLKHFEECTIERLDIDVFLSRISLVLHCARTTSEDQRHLITFNQVASFFYVNGQGRKRLEWLEPISSSEWTSGGHTSGGIGTIQIDAARQDAGMPNDQDAETIWEWARQYTAKPNFSLELGWAPALFIEASQIVVDDRIYDVGFPGHDLASENSSS